MKLTSTIFIIFLLVASSVMMNCQEFSRKVSEKEMGLKQEKQITHLHFYFHDTLEGLKATAFEVAQSAVTNSSATRFGMVMIMDDPLTVGPKLSSKAVGRAQGIYASADMTNIGFLMVLNLAFTDANFNGSTLSILGRNPAFSGLREMPIVGGSGLFRFASGYAQARTYYANLKTNMAIVEYNVYVFH